jgi:hypothetical protein
MKIGAQNMKHKFPFQFIEDLQHELHGEGFFI